MLSMTDAARQAMKLLPMLQKNPFMSQWMSAANAAAGAWRGQWMAEVARQQAMMLTQFNKQAMQFWTSAWMVPPAASFSELAPTAAAMMPRAPKSEPEAATPGPVPAPPVVTLPRSAQKPAAQLRTSEQRRSGRSMPQKVRAGAPAKKVRKSR
jgi:hypothetical protein